ncbi:MAG: UDP-N-acetylmuramyl-tripeptide synthetase, partial [Rectinema sp.]|nr:UDP-N-acetylmuramyl-tripeptide synthetase [Rectinema sp.]
MIRLLLMKKLLRDLLQHIEVVSTIGNLEIPIESLTYNSRSCKPSSLFFALPGIHTDGRKYIADAKNRGAAAVITEGPLEALPNGISVVQVRDCRIAMSAIACAFYDDPSASLCVIGVTGTEGKSTTVSLIYQLLNYTGFKTGFFSTVMSDTGEGEVPNPEHQTTPESIAVQQMLARMRDHGLSFAVVEASSHGLSLRTARLADVKFDIGVLTNITHEHLEFHGTGEQYRSDKANLFRRLGEGGKKKLPGLHHAVPHGIICADDPSAPYVARESAAPCLFYSSKGAPADLRALDVRLDLDGADFIVEGPPPEAAGRLRLAARVNLPGAFNVQNCLGAMLAASAASGLHWSDFIPLLPRLKPVRGRMQRIQLGQPFDVIIDYAHTPSSFMEILPPLRKERQGKIICVFGSGGERDRLKRPQQGRIAADYCDIIVLADEDPRGEDPMALLEEIASGCPELARGERLYLCLLYTSDAA